MTYPLKKRIPIYAFGICFFITNAAFAQLQKMLTLDDAIALSIAHSRQLKIDSTQLQIADSKIRQVENMQLPQVGVNLSYIRISDNITPFKANFPSGEVILNPQILNQSFNSLQIRQPVYVGGKVKSGIELLKQEKQTIYFDIEKNKLDAAYSITTLWYNLFVLKETRKIIEANIQLLTNQQKDAQNFVDQGVILANDVLKIDLATTNLRSSLTDINSNINQLKYNISLLTGLDSKTNIDIPETLPGNPKQNGMLGDYINAALKNRPELKGLNIRQKQSDVGLRLTKTDYLPTVSFGGNVNYNQPEQRLFPNTAQFTGTWNAGVFLNWNLSNLYTNKEKVKESKLNIIKVNQALDQATEGIQIEVNTDYNNYLQATEKINIATKEVELATENFRVEQNRFSNNITTPTEFLTANTQLVQSKINLTAATANAELAYKKLLKSTNSKN